MYGEGHLPPDHHHHHHHQHHTADTMNVMDGREGSLTSSNSNSGINIPVAASHDGGVTSRASRGPSYNSSVLGGGGGGVAHPSSTSAPQTAPPHAGSGSGSARLQENNGAAAPLAHIGGGAGVPASLGMATAPQEENYHSSSEKKKKVSSSPEKERKSKKEEEEEEEINGADQRPDTRGSVAIEITGKLRQRTEEDFWMEALLEEWRHAGAAGENVPYLPL